MGWSQPARAVQTVVVRNDTRHILNVDIIYHSHFCKDDHFVMGPTGVWKQYTGVCLIKSFTVRYKDQTCKSSAVGGQQFFRIMPDSDHGIGCIVRIN